MYVCIYVRILLNLMVVGISNKMCVFSITKPKAKFTSSVNHSHASNTNSLHRHMSGPRLCPYSLSIKTHPQIGTHPLTQVNHAPPLHRPANRSAPRALPRVSSFPIGGGITISNLEGIFWVFYGTIADVVVRYFIGVVVLCFCRRL